MRLVHARFFQLPTMDELDLSFLEPDGSPRLTTVIFGGGGVGKTSLLSSIASTRPGNAIVQTGRANPARDVVGACDWYLGEDDPERPHALRIVTPNARLFDDDREAIRKREQTFFDRKAKTSGFAFALVPSTRWFTRQSFALVAPDTMLLRHEVRSPSLDDPARSDLTRETKQVLSYAEIAAAVAGDETRAPHRQRIRDALRDSVNMLLSVAGYRFVGVDPHTLEPMFEGVGAQALRLDFNGLPTRARHLVGIVATTFRALWAARPAADPLEVEAVVCVDELELHQDPGTHSLLVPALRRAFPNVQWILTTSSVGVTDGCEALEMFALRRQDGEHHVQLYGGAAARLQ